MKLLFVHQNFPGQFRHLAAELARSGDNHEIVALTMNDFSGMAGVRVIKYRPARGTSQNIHPWVADTETKVIRAEAAFHKANELKQSGFTPDLIVAHPGWGESLFLKDVWPRAKLLAYCEFFYSARGADTGFDPEFESSDPGQLCRLRLKNINNLLHFEFADAGLSPTHWQRSTFPEPFRAKIEVIHDGIDTEKAKPNPDVKAQIQSHTLSRDDEVITFINRNLEPYRGYHTFIRSLPKILKARPKARILIVGGDAVSYGAKAPDGTSWKKIFLEEVIDQIDTSRVHFLGTVPYQTLLGLLQLSTVHVYLTYPFVLSWSLLEAMSCGCAIVASDTQPLHEAIINDSTGMLTSFFDVDALAAHVIALLEDPEKRARLGQAARAFAVENYDLNTVTLPKLVRLIHSFAD